MGKRQFWGTLKGSGKHMVERGGTKVSGLQVEAAGWEGRIRVRVWYDEHRKRDMFVVELLAHWQSADQEPKRIAEGILDGAIDDPFIPALIA